MEKMIGKRLGNGFENFKIEKIECWNRCIIKG